MYGETFYGRHTEQKKKKAAVKANKNKKKMSSFKSNENIRKKADWSYYVVSASKTSSVTPNDPATKYRWNILQFCDFQIHHKLIILIYNDKCSDRIKFPFSFLSFELFSWSI